MMAKLRFHTSPTHDDASALDALALRARGMSDATLLVLETAGLLAALAILMWIPTRPGFALPFIAIGMFGLWGITDHARRKSGTHSLRTALSAFQLLLATLGIGAVAALMFRIGGLAIGTVIS